MRKAAFLACFVTAALGDDYLPPEARIIRPRPGEIVPSSNVFVLAVTIHWGPFRPGARGSYSKISGSRGSNGDTMAVVIDGQQLNALPHNSTTISGVPDGPHWLKVTVLHVILSAIITSAAYVSVEGRCCSSATACWPARACVSTSPFRPGRPRLHPATAQDPMNIEPARVVSSCFVE